ncbi:MAG: hypothetical protein AAFN77_18110 [Planctomycetota bacterium]
MNQMTRFVASEQRPIRASFNCSSIVPDQSGKNEAIEETFNQLAQKCSVSDLFAKVDVTALDGVAITSEVSKEVLVILDKDPDSNQKTEALLNQAKEVLDFCGNRQNRLREATDVSLTTLMSSTIDQLFQAAGQVINEDPMLVEPVVEKIEDACNDFATRKFSFDYQKRLKNGCSAMEELQLICQPPIVSSAVGKKLVNQVFSAVRRMLGFAVEQKNAQLVDELWRRLREQNIRPRIESLRQTAQTSTEAKEAILDWLVNKHQVYVEQTQGKESNGVIKLPALTKDQVIDLLHRQDTDVEAGFRNYLIAEAKIDYPLATATNGASTTLPEIYPNLPPEFVGTCFVSFINRRVAAKLTVYKLVKGNVDSIVKKAYDLAAPLVDLQGRAIPQLNVQPTPNVIVSFPQAHDSVDTEVRHQMEQQFTKVDPQTAFSNAPAGSDEITITRLIAGFPASCMGHLSDQRDSYEAAHLCDHMMHIPGFASFDGKALSPDSGSSPQERSTL